MTIKIIFDGTKTLLEIAVMCGTAPCAILSANGLRSETQLSLGQTLLVPVVMERLINHI